jgi:hypothetical protein
MSAKVFIGSVIVSILILAPATYFLMPVLYPNIKSDISDDSTGILLQSEYFLFDSEAEINDNDLTYQMMNGTTCLITTQGFSRLSILFTAAGYMTLNGAWTEKSEYLIDLVVDSSANRAILLGFYDYGPVHGAARILFFDITINLVTDVLIAGTHNITVFWRSVIDGVGINSFYIYDPSNSYLRSLWIQEIYGG